MAYTFRFFTVIFLLGLVFFCWFSVRVDGQESPAVPQSLSENVSISLFAREPEIVTPTGIAVDQKGRVFCIESHTHFRPKDYKGPKHDRIRMFRDLDGDGKSDHVTTFFEGTTATMSLAFAPDGSLYVATRAQIFRLTDENNDGKADTNSLIVDLQTPGNYPHNGLAGVTFENGRMYFGFGENLGAKYELKGSDGKTLSGGGEGGNIYSCKPDGTDLQRIATGFWNPFGLAFDRQGNLFAIDNDPDWRPPCRLLHIVEGGDYGYRFDLGRRGTHPFTAWFGELPGTLGLVSGTGEAPSGIIRYDELTSDPNDTVLLSTSWGLHSLEQFVLKADGASFTSAPLNLIKGEKDFRPVALAIGPDGSIYCSDWCKRSYDLHGHGRIWKVTLKSPAVPVTDAAQKTYPYRSFDQRVRVSASNRVPAAAIDFGKAIQAALTPLEKANLIRRSRGQIPPLLLMSFFTSDDPFIRQAARHAFGKSMTPEELAALPLPTQADQRLAVALVLRDHCEHSAIEQRVGELLTDRDPRIRFVALRWIGERRLTQYANQIQQDLRNRELTAKLFESQLAALDLLKANRKGADFEKAEAKMLADLLTDPKTESQTKVVVLRKLQSVQLRDQFSSQHPALKLPLLKSLIESSDHDVAREAVQTIRELGTAAAQSVLLEIVTNRESMAHLAPDALIGLDPENKDQRARLIDVAMEKSPLGEIAIQALISSSLSSAEQQKVGNRHSGRPLIYAPQKRSERRWQEITESTGEGNAESGRLIFFNQRYGQCSKCHQVDGRGGLIGPDLTHLETMSAERLIESIRFPSKEIAPRHTSTLIETYDGKSFTGVLVAERGEEVTYADTNGKTFKIRFDEIERSRPVRQSIMPDALLDAMTDREVIDLMTFLKRSHSSKQADTAQPE